MAEEILRLAWDTDVRPLLAKVRTDLGAEADPLAAYRSSGYGRRIAADRQGDLEGGGELGLRSSLPMAGGGRISR